MPSSPIRTNSQQEMLESAVLVEPPPIPRYDEPENYTTINRLRVLLDERFTLLRFAACGLVLSTLIAFTIPFSYESRTQLMPPEEDSGSGLMSLLAMTARSGGGLGMVAGDMLGLKTSGALFIGILRSHTVEDRIIEQFDLKSVYHVRRMQDARRRLESNTEITEDRKSGIIGISVIDHSPQRASAIAQAYVGDLDRLVAELNTSAAHRERVFLEGRLKAVKQDLDTSAKEFSQFASKNTAIDIKEQSKAMLEAAAILQGNLIAAQSELEGLRQIYADTNVRVHAVRARIDELQKKLAEIGGGDLSVTSDLGVQPLYPSIRKLPLLGVTYAELYRNNKIQETVFELLTQQCELAKVQEAKETPSVKVLDVAKVPERKSFPPRLLLMFVGTFLTLLLGTVWVLGSASWQELDSTHPCKLLAHDALMRIKGDLGLASENGRRLFHMRDHILWFRRPPNKP